MGKRIYTHLYYLNGLFIFSRLCSPSVQEVKSYYHFSTFDTQNNAVTQPTPTQINASGKMFLSLSSSGRNAEAAFLNKAATCNYCTMKLL